MAPERLLSAKRSHSLTSLALKTPLPSKRKLTKFIKKTARLYEQEQRDPDGAKMLGRYMRRWLGWARGGLGEGTGHRGVHGMACAHSVLLR